MYKFDKSISDIKGVADGRHVTVQFQDASVECEAAENTYLEGTFDPALRSAQAAHQGRSLPRYGEIEEPPACG